MLRRYLAGEIDRSELYVFIAGFDWADGSAEALALRPPIGRLELFIEEVAEQTRDDSEVREAARRILAEASGSPRAQG